MRLTDSEAFELLLINYMNNPYTSEESKYLLDVVLNMAKANPTIEGVPVVRCKDCKHAKTLFVGDLTGKKFFNVMLGIHILTRVCMITVARARGEKQMRPIDGDKIGLNDIEIVMCEGSYKKALEMLIDQINNAPTVDAVPVVRCKYCKWFNLEIEFGEIRIGTCPYQAPYEHTHGEGYCFRGVRRESEAEDNG